MPAIDVEHIIRQDRIVNAAPSVNRIVAARIGRVRPNELRQDALAVFRHLDAQQPEIDRQLVLIFGLRIPTEIRELAGPELRRDVVHLN